MKRLILITLLLTAAGTYGQTDSLVGDTTKFNYPLREKILSMYQRDQDLRVSWGQLEKKYGAGSAQVDSIKNRIESYRHIHADSLKAIFSVHGFPTHQQIGKDGIQGLFVLVAHSKDLDFQELCLIYFIIEAKEGGLEWSELAILFDKIQVEKGKPQYFSTQPLSTSDGSFKLYPIADEKYLDQRREAFDMLPIREYMEQFGLEYVPTTKF
jgi:hypothetical protein